MYFSFHNEQTGVLEELRVGGGHLVCGSQMGGGGEAEFQGEGVGAVGYSDLVVVEDRQSLHSFSFTVKLQQTRQSL